MAVLHIHHKSNENKNETNLEPKVHLMPCTINTDGEAKVSEYFEPIIKKTEDEYLTASFRGYPLMGQEVTIPKGYSAHVFYEANDKLDLETDRNIYISDSFHKLTYWNYDKIPSINDNIHNALNWVKLASVLHEPI